MTAIQEKIGARIAKHRKALGLTMKALAERTDNLKPSRINNWERGVRTPGPEEAIQLAKALEISPAYLLGLTDDNSVGFASKIPGLLGSVPMLSIEEAFNSKATSIKSCQSYVPIGEELKGKLSGNTFALKVKDDSMNPSFTVGDVIIVEPSRQPKPGDFVVAKINDEQGVIVRQYKQTSYSGGFDLVALNLNWPTATVSASDDGAIIGVVLEVRHYY